MKRDMNLVRLILLAVEAKEDTFPDEVQVDGYSGRVVNYHVGLMAQAGLLDCMEQHYDDESHYQATALTWQGHEFLDAVRDPVRWNDISERMQKLGGFVFQVALPVLVEILKRKALDGLC